MNDARCSLHSGGESSTDLHHRKDETPNNIEAEQALLGAILVNNDVYYRVSDFLKPIHFNEPLHRKIFELAGDTVRMGGIATTITLKTLLPADGRVGDLTIPQYLARLAADAVTIINADDYGRAIYHLALRRKLITIGEDISNIAQDAPLDMPIHYMVDDAKRRLIELDNEPQTEDEFAEPVAFFRERRKDACGDSGWQHGLGVGFWLLSDRLERLTYKVGDSPIERQFMTACLLVNLSVHPYFNFACAPIANALADVFPQEKIEKYRVDFLILGAGPFEGVNIIVECDGHDFHERSAAQAMRDRERDRRLQLLGYHIMRFTGSELFNWSFCCACEVAIMLLKKSGAAGSPLFQYHVQDLEHAINSRKQND